MDLERVYGSDMKKMIRWFEILTKAGIEIKLSEQTAEEIAAEEAAPIAEKKTAKTNTSTKTATPKNAPVKKINTPRKMA